MKFEPLINLTSVECDGSTADLGLAGGIRFSHARPDISVRVSTIALGAI